MEGRNAYQQVEPLSGTSRDKQPRTSAERFIHLRNCERCVCGQRRRRSQGSRSTRKESVVLKEDAPDSAKASLDRQSLDYTKPHSNLSSLPPGRGDGHPCSTDSTMGYCEFRNWHELSPWTADVCFGSL